MKHIVAYYNIVEALCFVASLMFLRNEKWRSVWGLQRIYMAIVFFVELYGKYLIWRYPETSNQWLHNLYMPFIALFVGGMVFHSLKSLKPISNQWLYAWWALYGLLYLFETISTGGFSNYHTYTRYFLNLSICLGVLYFIFLLRKEEVYRDLRTFAEYWWMLGVGCFFIGHFAIGTNTNYLVKTNFILLNTTLLDIMFILLLIMLYGSWTYAFYLRQKARITVAPSSSLYSS